MKRNLPENVENLISDIKSKMPLHKNFLEYSFSKVTDEEVKQLDKYIDFCKESGLAVDYLADCYLMFVEDTMKEQIYFNKHKKYRFSTLEEVSGHVYFDDEYMHKYVYGIAISLYFWINHLELFRFFDLTFPRQNKGRYLEIGPGHGKFMLGALKNGKCKSFTGVDISKTSIRMTDSILKYFAPESVGKYDLKCMDFLEVELPYPDYDLIVMGEVIEHVEDPEKFLKKVSGLSSKDTYIFITTCINAPEIDHIYLYNNIGEVESQIKDCGFSIESSLVLPYANKTLEESEEKLLPINVAYVLKKA